MTKLLFYGESPCISTGLAQVSRTILDAIQDEIEIEVVAINHFLSDYDHSRYPYTIHRCPSDDCTNEKTAVERIKSGDYDLFMYSSDFGRYGEILKALHEEQQKRAFYTIGYFPVDCDVLVPNTFECLNQFNVSVVYTKYAKEIISKARPDLADQINVIYLACEPDKYYPFSKEKRRQVRKDRFDIDDDTFLCISVNRNQHRKDLGRLMHIFHEFHKKHKDSLLYMHCAQNDFGGSLPTMAAALGIPLSGPHTEIIWTGPDFNVSHGFTWETMNEIYNAADCLLSCSTGEGWGLSTTEAMAAGCPVIVPAGTANWEIVGRNEERGHLVKAGGDIDHQTWNYGFVNYPRDIVHSADMLKKMEQVYYHKKYASYYVHLQVEEAREWTLQHTPQSIGNQWKQLFMQLKRECEVLV